MIKSIHARQIFDSRGNPTVEVEVGTEDGVFRAAVPSGASTGIHEALELRGNQNILNQDNQTGYMGKSVLTAISNINTIIAPVLLSQSHPLKNQQYYDDLMVDLDGRDNKGRLGANAIRNV